MTQPIQPCLVDRSRRRFFRTAAGCLAGAALAPLLSRADSAGKHRTRLILLGTGGGPTPKPDRSAPAQAIVIDGVIYAVDCGNGVARQLVRAGLELTALRDVFITHQHSDHTADYGNLLWLAWESGKYTRVDSYGPPPLKRMTRMFLAMNDEEIAIRIRDEGRPPLAPLIVPHEIRAPGLVMQDERVKVSAALVQHPPVVPSFAYRFDGPDRSIVISGDTRPSPNLIELARGADVLVHEVMYGPAIERIAASDPQARHLREHLQAAHTTTEEVGDVATRAGVKTLVLSHFVPGGSPLVPDDVWRDAVRPHFAGEIIVGRDLLEI